MNPVLFCIFAVLLIGCALSVVLQPSPIRSALSLVATLFLLAVVFLFLDAYLVAALQVIVYAGAIMVLFLFVITLLNLQESPRAMAAMGSRWAAALVGSLFFLGAVRFFTSRSLQLPGAGMSGAVPPGFGSIEQIGETLFTRFLLSFEITSLVLLVAIVGAVVLAKRKLV